MGGGHRHYGSGCGSQYGTCQQEQSNPSTGEVDMNIMVQVVEVNMELVSKNSQPFTCGSQYGTCQQEQSNPSTRKWT